MEMGHRDIAHVSANVEYGEAVDDISKRRDAYKQALLDAGYQPDPRLIVAGSLQQQSGVLAVEMLLSRGKPFSAIFAANDQMAFWHPPGALPTGDPCPPGRLTCGF